MTVGDQEPSPLVEVIDFSLTFNPLAQRNLLDHVSLRVEAGKTLCIIGESGCGKSVTSLAMLGLLKGTKARIMGGRAMFGGVDLFGLDGHSLEDLRGGDIAMIFQEPMTSLNPAFTIGHQIVESIRRHQKVSRKAAFAEAISLLQQVGLPAASERVNNYPHQLSGGQRQRVMIAMAIANKPRLLIADEPTTALDVTIQAQILSLMKRLQEEVGSAIILITHDLRVVAEVADSVAVMYAGRVVETGPVDAIFSDPQHPYTIGLFGSTPSIGPKSGRLSTIEGSVPALEDFPDGCRFASRCPFADIRCDAEMPPVRLFGEGHSAACWYAPIDRLPASEAA